MDWKPENYKLNKFTLQFVNKDLEKKFIHSYDKGTRLPLYQGMIISIISWFSSFILVYLIIPEQAYWMVPLTIIYIGSYFGFLTYITYKKKLIGYYHTLGAISNAWAGLYTILYCHPFPNGTNLTLPVLIFIIFFGLYMVRLRWIAATIASASYTIAFTIFVWTMSTITTGEAMFNSFVIWMTFAFAVLAGRMVERNYRRNYVQKKIIKEQNTIIEKEKQFLLKEVHHRVKNNLQVIISLINLELSKKDRKASLQNLKKIQGRILSMSLVHLWLNQTEDFEHISLKKYVNNLISSYERNDDSISLNYSVSINDAIQIKLDIAIPLGLIINEIISNHCQHCNNSTPFEISCIRKENNQFILNYQDNGDGFPESTFSINEDKLGHTIIELLTDQIEGEFQYYNQEGARYQIIFQD